MKNRRMLSGKGDTWKRGLAFFLACVVFFSAFPVQVFAENEIANPTEETVVGKDNEEPGGEETPESTVNTEPAKDTEPTQDTEPTENTEPTVDTESTENTEPTVDTEPTENTEPTVDTEPTEETQPEETQPKDITSCTDQLALSLKDWWYANREKTVAVKEAKRVDYSEFTQDTDAPQWAGVTLRYEAVAVLAGDWFTVVLPEQFTDVRIREGFMIPEGIEFSLKVLEQPKRGTELTVRFSAAGAAAGELPLEFRLSASETVSILLQEDANQRNAYTVIPPLTEPKQETPPEATLSEGSESEQETLPETTLPEGSESEQETLPETTLPEGSDPEQDGMYGIALLDEDEPVISTFSIRGEISFDENLNGTNWRSILRPLEFDQSIKLIATYMDASGVEQTVEYHAQDSLPQDAFYLLLTHDGEGGGSFEIANVPDYLTLEDDSKVQVIKYTVAIDTSLPYYQSGSFDVTDMGVTQTYSTLVLTVRAQNLTLDPEVVGDQTETTFPMNVTFTNPSGAAMEQSTFSKTLKPTNTQSARIQVPVGVQFNVVQNPVSGYKWDSKYTVTTQTGDQEPVSAAPTENATGIIEAGTNVTVSTTNFMQNLTYPLSVIWVDNNNSARPTLGKDNFRLQYKTGDGEWTELTEDSLDTLGIDNLPTFDASKAVLGQYVYHGLTSIDANGNALFYQVVPNDLAGYTVSANDTNKIFTYRQTTNFHADISWMDSDNADNKRPESLPLKLYRHIGKGSYEEVTADLTVTETGNTWRVSVPDLPRYNDENREYDYVIVQGSIGENNTVTQTPIASYKTFYDNGTGNYGNDIVLCHNGGTIIQRIWDKAEFTATKRWEDPQTDPTLRPQTIVTLWRYAVPASGDPGIDSMYNQNLAAQVIYRKTTGVDPYGSPTYQDVLLSYQLSNQTEEVIAFTPTTVPNLPADFELPAYDEQGRRYVYFVREIVDSEYYETTYTSGNRDVLTQGAPNGGTVTNTRREKSAINITKVWQCPSNLPDIEGISVQMTILAPDQAGTYEELTVYSADLNSFEKLTDDKKTAAQTLSGFTENIATLELQFYVNIYDENGLPYDMTKAVVKEIKVLKQNGEEVIEIPVTETDAGTGIFTLNGNQYTAASTYTGQTTLADGMKEFQYKQTNTISGARNYTLTKRWQGFTESELAQYASVSFRLERRSSKDGAPYETVKTPDGESTWVVEKDAGWQRVLENLPKFDNQGYEYLYRAWEVSVTGTDGQPVSQSWSSYHFRTENSTTVTNYRGTGGGGAFYVTKTWMDNGDTEAQKPVTVRVYRKSDLLDALKDLRDSDVISLASLSNFISEHQLSTDNNWFLEVAVSYDVKDSLVLEYQVGGGSDGAVPAQYTVSQLRAAAGDGSSYSVCGTVSNSQRQYQALVERAENGMMTTITNTRIGQASLEVTKNWKDASNAVGKRPDSVRFQVYQDGVVYAPGSGIGSITSGEGVSATWDRSTGIITVSNTGDTNTATSWFFRLENLPLFSDTGIPHTYNVEEIGGAVQPDSGKTTDPEQTEGISLLPETDGGTQQGASSGSQSDTVSYYLSTKGETTVTQNENTPDRVTYGFTFDNTLTGTTAHAAHKSWQDRDSGGLDRPDLYLTLYRYLKSDADAYPNTPVEELPSFEQYTDCEDPNWTVDNAYHWRAKVDDLPLYDNQGREYVYRFQEALNNDGVTVYGTYIQAAEYRVTECETCADIAYVKPYDKFTNTLTDKMTISGVKTWTGFAGYQVEPRNYPAVTIELYRSLYPNIDPLNKKDTDSEFQQWLSNGSIEKVSELRLRYDAENDTYPTAYSFGTDENPLPKFNAEGRRWYYSIREKISDDIADSLYTEKFANGTLTNVFRNDVNRRSIAVTKTWAGREKLLPNEIAKYPSVTFYLYRYVDGQDTATLQPLKTVKIGANQFTENGTYTHTFEDLLIYSPSGEEYRYYITEAPINGYTVSYQDEDMVASPDERSDVISIPSDISAPSTAQVGTINTYSDPGKLKITGSKNWDDYADSDLIYGNRPDSIVVTLKRSTQNESGQANKITEETIELASEETQGEPYILWEKSVEGNTNSWRYTIYNLERYAPNGMPYIYSVTETPVDGYNQSNGTVTGTAGTTGDLALNGLNNSLGATYYVRKNWMDGNNKYGLRPTSITVVLQRSNDGGSTWQNIPWENSFGTYDEATRKWTGLPSVTTDEGGNRIVSIVLTADYVMNNTKGNSWQYTFTNLPEKDAAGNTWKYRCVETRIDNAEVKPVAGKENTYTAGAYACTYPIRNDEKTIIQNKLESTSLHVTKIWEGDQNDLYHSRPDGITFVLQMRGIVRTDTPSESTGSESENMESGGTSGEGSGSEGEFDLSDWKNVKVNGSDYTFTITKAGNWQKTLQDLPVAMVDEDGLTYYTLFFRAVEKHADDTVDANGSQVLGTKPENAKNYQDLTDYGLESSDHSYSLDLKRNESRITNRLILDDPAKNISVTKNWKREAGDSVTATFELLYKTVEEGENSWHCFGNQAIGDTWTGHTAPKGCVLKTNSATETCSHTLSWTDLPKYNRNGIELVYKVVEHPVPGYRTETEEPSQDPVSLLTAFFELLNPSTVTADYPTSYTFTNIELQSYTVKKVWQNTDYAEKTDDGFAATFQLQQQIEGSTDWTDVTGALYTLSSTTENDTQSYTWGNLPKYTTEGKQITYRAVETKINGKTVTANTNGSYIVTYAYDGADSPAFAGTETAATNRMVYGFVNLSKAAAYLAPSVAADGDKKLEGIVFDIYSGTGNSKTLYVSGIVTDANGNLTRNSDGTYGTEHKYLISGTYTLMEASTKQGYSVWKSGVTFTVGVNGPEVLINKDTGEHGTAWISTSGIGEYVLSLKTEYKSSSNANHTFGNREQCVPVTNGDNAYNLESRGVIQFTKTGDGGAELDTHANASGESKAYFGVYTDAACTNQVAGMMAAPDRITMVLTTLSQDGTDKAEEFLAKATGENAGNIPYLRKDDNDVLTLLCGTYYLKELVAPPGYKLDTAVRKAVISPIPENDGTNAYADNKASIMLVKENTGAASYSWANTENRVTLYKRDQYGRIVTLGNNGYLELEVEGEGNTFLTGENTIRLYQDTLKAATKADGTTLVPNISYDVAAGSWTIRGLFDIGKTYTLSEPDTSVPDNNILAKPLSFSMGANGSITVTSGAESKVDPLAVQGDDYENYYNSNAEKNVVVLRDVYRFLKDVALKKVVAGTQTPIENISFKLYQYETVGENGEPENPLPVLAEGTYLTTNADGEIQLSNQPEAVQNLITGCALKYGLDVGKYYFQESERGASDTYRLTDKVFFEIAPKNSNPPPTDYNDYAQVTFTPTSEVSQSGEKTGVVQNTPVTANPKSLVLTKVDSENNEANLSGAQFTLTYTSTNNGQDGAQEVTTYRCRTGPDGVLYLCDTNGDITFPKAQPDISKKGTYVLVETQAPDSYMTRTENGTQTRVTMVTFNVNSENQITNVQRYDGQGDLVSATVTPAEGEHTSLVLTVKNEKTVVSIAKRNDIESNTKTSSLNGELLSGTTLEIYEGIETTGNPVARWTSDDSEHTLDAGTLKENTIYTLHESAAPVGYLVANDIFFKLFGTTTKAGNVVSQLSVWTGGGTPVVDGTGWSKVSSINDAVLTMVDEAIIAPVDLQKVVGADDTYSALPGAEFEVKSLDGEGTVLGTAVTDSTGHLVWQEVTNPGGLIFNANGKRITDSAGDKATVIGKTILLRQNSGGYQFTEIYAPDHAYNEGKSFTVKITAKNYTDYRSNDNKANIYVDILAANTVESKTVEMLSVRENTPEATDLVNPPFEASFELYKYDAEHPQINPAQNNYGTIGLQGVTFTLYKQQADGTYPQTGTAYTTGENGLLHIDLTEKGTYRLVETGALNGYTRNTKEMVFTVLNGDYQKTLTYTDEEGNANHTKVISAGSMSAAYGLPNNRIHGSVTLTKQDADSDIKLNGVQYTLTRIDPVSSSMDKWFPKDVSSITVETGKTYTVVASAADEAAFTAGISTGDSGVLVINDLQWGSYTLVEQQESDGYILDTGKTFPFTIDANGLSWIVKENGNAFVTNTKNQLTIQKTASDGTTPLSGAQFQLYPVTHHDGDEIMGSTAATFFTTASEQTAEGTTITAGVTTIYGLTKGTYVLREIKAPDGYRLTKDVIFTMSAHGSVSRVTTCTVGEDNKITQDLSGDAVVTLTTSGTGTGISNTLTVKDTPIKVSLTKALLNNAPINGRGDAIYDIRGVFAGETRETTKRFTGNSIELTATLIGGNSYTIIEIKAPDGYEVQNNSATIHVATDGIISVELPEGDSFLAVDTTGTALTFTDDPIELTLEKVDASRNALDETTLGYAMFKIQGRFVKEDGSGTEETIISGLTTENFQTTLSKRLIGGETYYVEETNPPKGYKVAAPFYIQVNQYGQIVKRGATVQTMADVNPATDTLVVTDEPTVISFKKVEDGNKPLAGATFTLTGNEFVMVDPLPAGVAWVDDTHRGLTWTSTKDVTTLTNLLIANVRYTLRENRVLYHEVMEGDIVFHLEPDGTVKIDTNSTIPNQDGLQAASISDDGIVMTIQNPTVKGIVTLTKSGENIDGNGTHLLANAVYTLTMTKDANGNDVTGDRAVVMTNDDNTYQETGGTKSEFTTDSNGQIVITGLPEGYYQFREIGAPEAYQYHNTFEAEFHISYAGAANVTVSYENSRINAKLKLAKYSESSPLEGAVFDVSYCESENGTYRSIAKITTGSNGEAVLEAGIFTEGGDPEGLWRGFYRLTELSADGQMLNTTDGTRNTISFQIDNEINKVYEVKSGTDVTYTVDGSFISLTENGAVDIPIPTKSLTVTKVWAGDSGLDKTFRPASVQVQLYRSHNGGIPIAVEGCKQTLNADNSWTHTWTDLPAYVNDGTGDQKTTCLYTYTVKEADAKGWYTVTYRDVTAKTETQDPKVEDGDTVSTVTNTLVKTKTLTIRKTLGGGSAGDAFRVRIKLTKDGQFVGNNGYYMDPYAVSGTTEPKTPDENGWMTIHGGESITVKLPEGVTYTVEEQTTSGTVTGTVHTDLTYTPRYDSNRSGTIGTVDTAATTIRNAVHKSLNLVKQNESGAALAGAEFTVSYVPLEDSPYAGTAGTKTFTTNTAGQLLGEDGKPIDLTNQGTYTLKEIKAPAGYITPTDNNGNPIVLATITVDANDEMSVKSNSPLVTVVLDAYASQASVTVKNEQTKARIGKTIDYANGTALKGAKLEIYGSDHKKVLEWTTGSVPRLIGDGTLKEGVVYRLHEVENSAPVGYLEAGDVYFKLNGTYTDTDGNRYSRIVITDEEGNTTDAAGRAISQNTDGSVYGDPGVVGGVLNMVDKSIRVPVTLKKVLEYSPLSDVIFTVTNNDTTPGTVIGTAKTGTDGFLVWEKTENGHNAGEEIVLQQNTNGYTFTETYAPDHAYNDGRMFTVNPTDHNFIDYLDKRDLALNVRTNAMETKDAGFAADTGTVINLPYKSTVTLYKYDKEEAADSAAISGAEFTLYHATVNESGEWTKGEPVDDAYETGQTSPNATGVFTTNASGNLSIEIHNKGYYILEETAAVSGYKLDTKNPPRFPFTLIDGTSDDVAAKKEFCYDGTAVLKAEGDAKGVPNEKIHLSLIKVDYKNHDSKLAGVTFTLEPANGSSFINSYVTNHPGEFSNGKITLTTDENGKISIPPGLVQQNHSYILTETDLGGNTSYRLADSETDRQITVLVNEDGTMTITSPNAMFGLAEGNETALVVKNQQISLTVAKRDQATGEPVEGVTLQLSKEVSENNWSPVALDGVTGANGQWVTDAAGTVTFQGTVFTPGTYRLEEISAPDGYNTVADSLTFAIDQSGKVATAKVGENDWTDLTKSNRNFTITNPTDGQPGGITLDVANAAYSDLKITKTGSDGALLGGVEFRLDYLDGTNRTVPATTSNEEGANKGIATFSGLPNGKYRLTELNTAQGYNLLSAPLEIEIDRNSETYTVSSNGTVISGENGLTRDGDTILLPVINQKGLVLPATGTTTPQLPRAVLGLTALLEGLVLYLYQMQGKRRKRETKGKK